MTLPPALRRLAILGLCAAPAGCAATPPARPVSWALVTQNTDGSASSRPGLDQRTCEDQVSNPPAMPKLVASRACLRVPPL